MKSPAILGLHFAFDNDFVQKFAVAVVSAAVAAAFSAGLDAAVSFLSNDPKYAAYAVVISALAAAISRKK